MKKVYFTLLLTAAIPLLSACSSDEPNEQIMAEPRLNVNDSIAMMEIFDGLKYTKWADWRDWINPLKPDTWQPHCRFKLDHFDNEYRIVEINLLGEKYPQEATLSKAISKLDRLEQLNVNTTKETPFEFELFPELFDCPLISIDLNGPGVKGSVPAEIAKSYRTFRSLKINFTNIESLPQELDQLLYLQYVRVQHNPLLTGQVPLCFRELPGEAMLTYNSFTSLPVEYLLEDYGNLPLLNGNCIYIPEELKSTPRYQDYWRSHLSGQRI